MPDNDLQSTINSVVSPATSAAGEEKPLGDIYTMPSVYMQGSSPEVKKINPKLWWWVGLGAVVLAGIVTAVYFIFFSSDKTPIEVVVNQPVVKIEPEPPIIPEAESNPQPVVTPADRDLERYQNIKLIQSALDLYYMDKEIYPIAVSEIILGAVGATTLSATGFSDFPQPPMYLKEIPQDPLTNSQTYNYRYSSVDGTAYKLDFILEIGVGNLSAGQHFITAQGFDKESAEVDNNPTDNSAAIQSSLDTDNDSLTDIEEQIYGTDVSKADSDSDSYNDGNEVRLGYNPMIGGGARLDGTALVTTYINDQFNYSILYPASWQLQNLNQLGSEVVFTGASGEFVQVTVQDNPEQKTALDWYQEFAPELVDKVTVINLSVGQAVKSPNGLNLYLSPGSQLITISYNNGTNQTADYLTTFELMYQSFRTIP